LHRHFLVEQRIALINLAMPLTDNEAVIESHESLSKTLALQLQTVIQAIRIFDIKLREYIKICLM
jgi:hypothetical protein